MAGGRMVNLKIRQKGLTIMEVMLVLAIASAMILMGMRAYESFKHQADALGIASDVDALAQAASRYYYANCYGTTNPSTGKVTAGTLKPVAYSPNTYLITVPLDITTDLINTGYLSAKLSNNPLVNNYAVQFVETIAPVQTCTSTDCATTTQTGSTVQWKIEVGVVLKDMQKISTYASMLQASCISTTKGSNGFASCQDASSFSDECNGFYQTMLDNYPTNLVAVNSAQTYASNIGCGFYNIFWGGAVPPTGDYMVFERSPSYASSKEPPELWLTNPTVNQFTQQYRSYPITYLTNTKHSPEYQYINCGS